MDDLLHIKGTKFCSGGAFFGNGWGVLGNLQMLYYCFILHFYWWYFSPETVHDKNYQGRTVNGKRNTTDYVHRAGKLLWNEL